MAELYDQGMDGGDGQDSAADTSAETGLRPVNENGQESWAEDQEPLTRGEYADQVRQDEATGKNDGTHDGQDHDDSDERAAAEDDQEQEELPEPRTRQEVAEEARSGTGPLTGDAAELLERAADTTAENPSPDPDRHEKQGHDQGDNLSARLTVVQADAADRTVGDTTPTGIGLKPTGSELVRMENEEASKPEKLRSKFLEGIDDINDAARENASLGHDLLTRHHPPAGHAVTEVPHPAPEASHEGGAAPDITSAGLVAGILLIEAARLTRDRLTRSQKR